MLDNLRDQAASSPYFQEDEVFPAEEPQAALPPPKRSLDEITGMSAQQRFFIALMVLVVVCVVGVMFLMVTGRMGLPFFS